MSWLSEHTNRVRLFTIFFIAAFTLIFFYGGSSVVSIQDEHIYFLMGKAILGGYQPYRDFFSAHMPLFLYSAASMFSVFGVSISAGKIIPLTASLAVALLTLLIGERMKKGVGFVAVVFMISVSVHFHIYSHSFFGLFYSLALVMGSLYLKLKGKFFSAGFLGAASLLVRLNVLPLVLAVALINPKRRFFVGSFMVHPFVLIFLSKKFVGSVVTYHMFKEPFVFLERIQQVSRFFMPEIVLSGFFIIGCVGFFRFISFRRGEVKLRFENDAVAVVYASLFASVLSVVVMSRPYHYYFTVLIPFVFLAGVYVVSRYLMFFRGKWISVSMVCLISVFGFFGGNIKASYDVFVPEGFTELSDFISANSDVSDEVLFVGGEGGSFVVLNSGRWIPPDLIDTSFQRYFVFNESMDGALLDALMREPAVVVTDLSFMAELEGESVSIHESLSYLFGEYQPSFHVFGSFYPDLMVVWTRNDGSVGGRAWSESNLGLRNYYRLFYTKVDGLPFQDEWVGKVPVNFSGVVAADILGLGAELFVEDMLVWPVDSSSHYVLSEGDLNSFVWVRDISDEIVYYYVLTYRRGRMFSFASIEYDAKEGVERDVRVFTRFSDPPSSVFLRTLKQVTLSDSQYDAIIDLIKQRDSGLIDPVSFRERKRIILGVLN